MNAHETLFAAWVGSSAIASITWFFACRPRLYIRVFVPREDYRGAVAAFIRDTDFRPGMRRMAVLQWGVGCIFGFVGLAVYVAELIQ